MYTIYRLVSSKRQKYSPNVNKFRRTLFCNSTYLAFCFVIHYSWQNFHGSPTLRWRRSLAWRCRGRPKWTRLSHRQGEAELKQFLPLLLQHQAAYNQRLSIWTRQTRTCGPESASEAWRTAELPRLRCESCWYILVYWNHSAASASHTLRFTRWFWHWGMPIWVSDWITYIQRLQKFSCGNIN